jgi:hypothetical protein
VTGKADRDRDFLVMMSAAAMPVRYTFPAFADGGAWKLMVDTRAADGEGSGEVYRYGSMFDLPPRTMLVFLQDGGPAH